MEEIIDVNTMFGPLPAAAADLPVDELAGMVSKHSVRAGLTLSTVGMLLDPMKGNAATRAACAEMKNLLPVATINPQSYFGDDAPARLATEGFRMVRFFPSEQGWDIQAANFVAVVQALEAQRMPLMIDVEAPGVATRLMSAIGSHTGPIILGCVDETNIAEAVALMRSYANLFVETSSLLATGALKRAVEAVGAGRFLYGSGAPSRPMAGSIGVLRHAGLADADLARILGANAREMFQI